MPLFFLRYQFAGKILKYKMREAAVEKYNLKKAESIETA